jgi:hypothetical protein
VCYSFSISSSFSFCLVFFTIFLLSPVYFMRVSTRVSAPCRPTGCHVCQMAGCVYIFSYIQDIPLPLHHVADRFEHSKTTPHIEDGKCYFWLCERKKEVEEKRNESHICTWLDFVLVAASQGRESENLLQAYTFVVLLRWMAYVARTGMWQICRKLW